MIEKILERLEEQKIIRSDDTPYGIGVLNGYAEAIQIVQEVAKEYGKDTNVPSNGWIPCSEQFPKEYVSVLICDREGDIYVALMYDTKIYGKIWIQRNGGELRQDWVIAWQPLPAPYQKGE